VNVFTGAMSYPFLSLLAVSKHRIALLYLLFLLPYFTFWTSFTYFMTLEAILLI